MGFTCHSLNRSFSVAPLDATLVSGRFRSQMSIEWLPKMNNGGAVHVSRLPCQLPELQLWLDYAREAGAMMQLAHHSMCSIVTKY